MVLQERIEFGKLPHSYLIYNGKREARSSSVWNRGVDACPTDFSLAIEEHVDDRCALMMPLQGSPEGAKSEVCNR